MADIAEVAACLRSAVDKLAEPGADVGWSASHESVDHLRREVLGHLARVEAGDLSTDHLRQLKILFGPTGALQEASIASGWDEEFLALGTRFDAAVTARRG